MKRFLSVVFSIIALFVLVAIIGIVSLAYFVDPNKMRPVIVEEVMNRTGYQLAIYGKLNWKLYPTVGINVQRMTLTSPDQLEPFIDLRNVTIASELSHILHGSRHLEGDLHVADMMFMNMHIENTHIKLGWEKNVLTISPIKAYLYGGVLSGDAHGRDLNKVPEWDWNVKLDGVQLQPLLLDMNYGQSRLNVAGKGHVEMNASTSGLKRSQLITNLDGKTSFSVENGSVKGVDLNYLIESATALINRQPVTSPSDNSSATRFDSFTGAMAIKNGLASTDNLLLTAPAFTTKGAGSINLLYQAINLSVQVKPQNDNAIKWEVPVLITGTLSSPDVRLDLSEVQRFIAQTQVNKVKEKVSDEISKHVTGPAGEALQNLLGK